MAELSNEIAAHAAWLLSNGKSGKRAYFGYANLRGADFSELDVRCADFHGANLKGANFSGADVGGADLKGANLEGANFEGANLKGANLRCANLNGADFSGSDVGDANFGFANLEGANLGCIRARRANFDGAKLHGADLRGGAFRYAKLRNSDLSGADLRGADLRGSRLDFASWPLWCGSREGVRLDRRQQVQLLAHVMAAAPDLPWTSELARVAATFHRAGEFGTPAGTHRRICEAFAERAGLELPE